jgi:hypothetical protein
MRRPRSIGLLAVLSATLMLASGAMPTSAFSGYFGATLDKTSQPSNAESGQPCDDNGGIPTNATCTWVSVQAYRNGPTGNKAKAPKDGRIRQIRLVTCVKGSFTLQIVRKQSNGAFKVVRSGPTINYAADPYVADGDPETFCGGEDGIYKVQKFATDFTIKKGSYIAIKAKKTGTLYCSGGSGVALIAPALGTGQQSKPDGTASCNLLVALYYQ